MCASYTALLEAGNSLDDHGAKSVAAWKKLIIEVLAGFVLFQESYRLVLLTMDSLEHEHARQGKHV
jgi:hypothetical protein